MSTPDTPFPYTEFLDQFEEAIYWHMAWYSRGLRQLIFNPDGDEDLTAKDAHMHCRLGTFLARIPAPPGCLQMVEQIDTLHEKMHALMRNALLERREGSPFDEEAYAELEEMQSLFFTNLHGLFRKMLEDQCMELIRRQIPAQAAS